MKDIKSKEIQLIQSHRGDNSNRQSLFNKFDTQQTNKQVQKTQIIQTYKHFFTFVTIAIILSISSFQFGYALCQVSTVPITELMQIFDINLSKGIANGILVGIMPIGGIFGSILNSVFVRYLSRKQIHYVISCINIVSTVLEQLTFIQSILLGRFLLGICCGIYTMIAPQFIQQISPPSLRSLFGSFFSLGRIIGIIFCYTIGLIFYLTNTHQYWRIMFIIPGILAILQAILIFLYVPDTPVELVQKEKYQELQQVISRLYKPQHVQHIILEYKVQNSLQKERTQTQLKLSKTKEDPLAPNKRRAFYMAIHLHNYRQLLGVNTVVAFGGIMIQSISPGLSLYANLLLNGVQGIVTIPSTFYIGKKVGRRPLYLWSGLILGISCWLVTFGYLFEITWLAIMFIFVYMTTFGLLFSPVSWSYPAQIVSAHQSSIGNVFSWTSLALTMVIPPIIINRMNGNAWTVFGFFAVYITISLIYMYNSLVQTKQKRYQDFIKQF